MNNPIEKTPADKDNSDILREQHTISAKSQNTDGYLATIEHARYEGQLIWQIFGTFLVAHTVFLAFLLQAMPNVQQDLLTYHWGIFFAGIVGLILCLPWIATYFRSADFYRFRMAQARLKEPEEWQLIRNTGEKFAEGHRVFIDGRLYQVSWIGKILRPTRSLPVLVVTFAIMYVIVIVISWPW